MAKIKRAMKVLKFMEYIKSGRYGADITRALYAAGQLIEIDAEISITEGSISGKGHIPSKPGEPPNADTRLLDTSIDTTIEAPSDQGDPRVHVTSNAPYSAPLEDGTSRVAARPYMKPATERNRSKAVDLVYRAHEQAMKRSFQ